MVVVSSIGGTRLDANIGVLGKLGQL